MQPQKNGSIALLDRDRMLWVQKIQSPTLTTILKGFTYSGTGKAWVLFAIFLNVIQLRGINLVPQQASFLRAMLCALGAWIASTLIKRLVNRRRPSEQIEGYVALIPQPVCRSFPSSHASASVAFATALLFLHHP